MTRVLAVSNQKGGVGKTTSAVSIARFAALAGQRVLVVDSDPQANASSILARSYEGASVYGGGQPQPTSTKGMEVIPAGRDLKDHERRLGLAPGGRLVLGDVLKPLRERYDLIVIDCPPSQNLLPINALLTADRLLVPIQCEYLALEGLGLLLSNLTELADEGVERLPEVRILLTMSDPALPLSREVEAEVRRHFAERVLRTVIPRDPALAVAPSHGKTIADHDPLSPGALAYLAAAKELLDVH